MRSSSEPEAQEQPLLDRWIHQLFSRDPAEPPLFKSIVERLFIVTEWWDYPYQYEVKNACSSADQYAPHWLENYFRWAPPPKEVLMEQLTFYIFWYVPSLMALLPHLRKFNVDFNFNVKLGSGTPSIDVPFLVAYLYQENPEDGLINLLLILGVNPENYADHYRPCLDHNYSVNLKKLRAELWPKCKPLQAQRQWIDQQHDKMIKGELNIEDRMRLHKDIQDFLTKLADSHQETIAKYNANPTPRKGYWPPSPPRHYDITAIVKFYEYLLQDYKNRLNATLLSLEGEYETNIASQLDLINQTLIIHNWDEALRLTQYLRDQLLELKANSSLLVTFDPDTSVILQSKQELSMTADCNMLKSLAMQLQDLISPQKLAPSTAATTSQLSVRALQIDQKPEQLGLTQRSAYTHLQNN